MHDRLPELLCGLGVPQPSGTVVPLAEVVLALAEHPQPLHVRRLHELILDGRLLDDGDVAPDGEAVVLKEPRILQALHGDEPREAPAAVGARIGARGALGVRWPRQQPGAGVYQGEPELGVDDAGALPLLVLVVVTREEEGDVTGGIPAVPIGIATDLPSVACRLEPAGLEAAAVAVDVLEVLVTFDLEHVVPRGGRHGGDRGNGHLWRRRRHGCAPAG